MILQTLAEAAKKRIVSAKRNVPIEELKASVYENGKVKRFTKRDDFAFEKALKKEGISFICEVKKASPSKGILAPDFPYLKIAAEYEEAGASAVSVLTEPEHFKGRDAYLKEISERAIHPCPSKRLYYRRISNLRIKLLGADAVLLICGLLDTETLKSISAFVTILSFPPLWKPIRRRKSNPL